MFAAHVLRESNNHAHIRCTNKHNTHIQYRRPLPYRADRSAQYGKDRLYCMHMNILLLLYMCYYVYRDCKTVSMFKIH